MDEISITAVQRSIDAKEYPPTHCYDVTTLTPWYPLDERLKIVRSMCAEFFAAEHFLDVGCSKGFFSLLAARDSVHVLSVDPDKHALDAWKPVCPQNVTQVVGTFKDVEGSFDLVWIGNGHHYLYREDPKYVERLKRLATNLVMIEGPTGPECREMRDFGPYQTEAEFLESMNSFDLIDRRESTAYTKGRAVWLFKTR